MDERPLTWSDLVRYHRDILVPEFAQLMITRGEFDAFRRETNGHFDAIYKRFDRVDSELDDLRRRIDDLEK